MVKQSEIDKEIEGAIWIIKENIKAIDNKHRREILRLCKEKPRTISELKRILDSSNKVTWHNVKLLEKHSLVKLDKRLKEKHMPVYVESNLTPTEVLLFTKVLTDEIIKMGKKSKK